MDRIRAEIAELERRADVAEWNENHTTARLLRRVIASLEAAVKEDERRLHQLLNEEWDLKTASDRTGIPYKTLWRKVNDQEIPNVGSGSQIKVRVGDLPCRGGWLGRLLGLERPEETTARDPGLRLQEDVSEDELREHRSKRRRRAG